jgi:hypothetical protein
VDEQAAEQSEPLGSQPKDDRASKRVAEDMSGSQAEVFNECTKIRHILSHTPLRSGSLALAVAAPVEGEDAERACKCWDELLPGVVIAPGTVMRQPQWPPAAGAAPPAPLA